MRIRGAASLERRGVHRLVTSEGAVVELQIASVPIDLDMAISAALPEPRPPKTVVGQRMLPTGREPIEKEDDGPEFQKRHAEWYALLNAAIAYVGLRREGGIAWDTPTADPSAEFFRSILDEMTAIGFTANEIGRLALAVRELGKADEKTLEAAKADFLRRTEAAPSSG